MSEVQKYIPAEAKRPDQRVKSAAMSGVYNLAEKSSYITIPLGVATAGFGWVVGSVGLVGMAAGGIMMDMEGNRYFKQMREAEQKKSGIKTEGPKKRNPIEVFNFMKLGKTKNARVAA